jgi:Leucine-rich repeat (LRR) protein
MWVVEESELLKIKEIHLNYLRLNKVNCEDFSGLSNLKKLDLSDNNFNSIENCDFFKELEYLNLANNKIDDLENLPLGKLTNLKTLILDGNYIRFFIPDYFIQNNLLKEISLSDNLITHLAGNYNNKLQNLTRLNLENNRIDVIDPSHFYNSNIKKLNLGKNHIVLMPSYAFEHATKLEDLNLDENNIISLGHNCFKFNTALKSLTITYNPIHKISKKMTGLPDNSDLFVLGAELID